jgi:hypothetical protein
MVAAVLREVAGRRFTIGHQEGMLKAAAHKDHFFRDYSRDIRSNIGCRSDLPESSKDGKIIEDKSYLLKRTVLFI